MHVKYGNQTFCLTNAIIRTHGNTNMLWRGICVSDNVCSDIHVHIHVHIHGLRWNHGISPFISASLKFSSLFFFLLFSFYSRVFFFPLIPPPPFISEGPGKIFQKSFCNSMFPLNDVDCTLQYYTCSFLLEERLYYTIKASAHHHHHHHLPPFLPPSLFLFPLIFLALL